MNALEYKPKFSYEYTLWSGMELPSPEIPPCI